MYININWMVCLTLNELYVLKCDVEAYVMIGIMRLSYNRITKIHVYGIFSTTLLQHFRSKELLQQNIWTIIYMPVYIYILGYISKQN